MSALPETVFDSDFITVLKSAGPLLTKVFDGDKVEPYGDAKNFSVEKLPVSNIRQLSTLLKQLETQGRRCVIRGDFVGDAAAQSILPPTKPGLYLRKNALYEEVPHHWVMFDIDRYESILFTPATEPVETINDFIASCLPAEFQGASYHWQLSSSAGQPGKEGILKAHIWFWLNIPFTGPELKSWVRHNNLTIDVAPLRKVQVHYVANPVFQNGAVDPVPVRSGLFIGQRDSVDLTIPKSVLSAVETHDSDDVELSDPREKPGLIGAFCRAFPVSRVINEILVDEFVFAEGSDRRVTWLSSEGGSPQGCFTTDDDDYLGNTHNSDPFDGRLANAFDLVRWYKFGHLDQDLDLVTDVFTRPSYRAMLEWAGSLEEVRGEAVEKTTLTRESLADRLLAATSEAELRNEILPEIKSASMEKVDREHLAKLLQGKWRALVGTAMKLADARELVAPERRTLVGAGDSPGWLAPWVYVTDNDKFLNLENKEMVSRSGFDMMHNSLLAGFTDENGITPNASRLCSDLWALPTVTHTAYLPSAAQTFEMLGVRWANLYRPESVPAAVPVLTDEEETLIKLVEEHVRTMFPVEEEANFLLDYLAFNVQCPGTKVRYAPFIHGTFGDGKTFLVELMGRCMGAENVKTINATTLGSDFTGWATGAALICIEEAKLHGHNNWDIVNKLKPYITNNTVEIHAKGRDPFNVPNVTNYMAFSNYADGVPIEQGDRRWVVLASAISTEKAESLEWVSWCNKLFEAMEGREGALRHWLLHRKLSPSFNPNGRAIMTEAKALSIELSKSGLRLAAEDLIEKGTEGVTKDAISCSHFTAALEGAYGEKVHTTSANKILTQLGYKFIGRKWWKNDMRRIWTRQGCQASCLEDAVKILNAAGFDEDFLQ